MRNIFYRPRYRLAFDSAPSISMRMMSFICIMLISWFAASAAVSAAPRASDAKQKTSSAIKSKTATKADSFASKLAPNGKSGIWWARENGWGISLTSSTDNTKLFAALYIYDEQGNARWYTASDCRFVGNQCTSRMEETSGATCAMPFSPGQVSRRDVGALTLDFSSSAIANMSFEIGGVKRSVAIERLIFAAGPTPANDYSGVWWNPNESGNGASITHLADTVFIAWYVFDTVGKPIWYVMSCIMDGTNSCSGTLLSANGPALSTTFDITQVQLKTIGTGTLTFSSSGAARIAYQANGQTITKDFVRLVF
jgi:hypothetical protein